MTSSVARTTSRSAGTPRWLVTTSLALSAVGLAVAGYLTFEHFTAGSSFACPETGTINCVKVTTSSYAVVAGIPVALLGLAFFAAMTVMCLPAAWSVGGPRGVLLRRVRLASAAVGVAFVFYLVWAELFEVDAICLWCTAVHLITVALFATLALGTAALRE